jgi:hypothetical protein
MLRDSDVVGDEAAPRHAMESDEEDDLGSLSTCKPDAEHHPFMLRGTIPTGRQLIFTSGDSALYWAQGAQLGEQQASITLDGKEVFLSCYFCFPKR